MRQRQGTVGRRYCGESQHGQGMGLFRLRQLSLLFDWFILQVASHGKDLPYFITRVISDTEKCRYCIMPQYSLDIAGI